MKMKLNTLSIRNFKGIKEYKLDPDGQSINILGDNGTGKTTLYDAFLWLLFGKNSENQATFDWKPLDKDGNELHHLETEVTAELEIDGQVKTLSRMTEENWVKKRGSATETFSGHNSTYKIDDLELNMREYDAFINELIDERLFKILTDVTFFSTDKMTYKKGKKNIPAWKARRETLIGMVGDITDDDVIDENDTLEPLKELIKERPIDELKQLTGQKMSQINKQIKELPNRIDEVDRSLPNITGFNQKELKREKEAIELKVAKAQEQIAELKNSDAAVFTKNNINELNMMYREKELEHNQQADEPLKALRDKPSHYWDVANELRSEQRSKEIELEDRNRESDQARKRIKTLREDQEKLRNKFREIQQQTIEPFEEHQKDCPTCGQELPEDQIEKLRTEYQKEVEAFNSNRAQKLKDISEEGKTHGAEIEHIEQRLKEIEENSTLEVEIEELEQQIKNAHKKINDTEKEMAELKATPFEETDQAKKIKEDLEKLKLKLDDAQGSTQEDIEKHQKEIMELNTQLELIASDLRDIDFYNRQVTRKEELIEQEQQLSMEFGKQEQIQHLLEEFTKTKVNLLTETINDKFEIVKFKLFDEQVNGGLNEVCETTVNGANYSTGLNNAAKINAGLDIIGTLMEHYGIQVPVWIDNAESINEILEIETQMITLAVSKHKNLRVEATS